MFEDSIINYDTTIWINNMNTAITATNVILNTAISPTLWLIPSSMIILKNPIEGYNNKLKVSSEEMKFGINKKLNFYGGENKTKLEGSEIKKDLKEKEIKKIIPPKTEKEIKKNIPPKTENENFIILALSLGGGFLISKYLF